MLKVLTIVVAGVLTIITLKRVFQGLKSVQARVKARNPERPQGVTRLKQDPKTGVYYPES